MRPCRARVRSWILPKPDSFFSPIGGGNISVAAVLAPCAPRISPVLMSCTRLPCSLQSGALNYLCAAANSVHFALRPTQPPMCRGNKDSTSTLRRARRPLLCVDVASAVRCNPATTWLSLDFGVWRNPVGGLPLVWIWGPHPTLDAQPCAERIRHKHTTFADPGADKRSWETPGVVLSQEVLGFQCDFWGKWL